MPGLVLVEGATSRGRDMIEKLKKWLCRRGWHKFAVVIHVTPGRKYPVRMNLYCTRCPYMRRTGLYEVAAWASHAGWDIYFIGNG